LEQERRSGQQPGVAQPKHTAKSPRWVGNPALLAVPKRDIVPEQPGEAGRPHFITELTRESSNYTNTRSIT